MADTEESQEFLDSLVRNDDGSITIERRGRMATFPSDDYFFDAEPFNDRRGISPDLNEYVGKILGEMPDINPGDEFTYRITVLPKGYSK